MQTTEEEVKCNPPVCQISEIGEGSTRSLCLVVSAVPAKYYEYGDEGVERKGEAQDRKEDGSEQPGGCVTI